jgi:hypothetical protein
LNRESKYSEQDNDWANDVKGNPIHINTAESGAKGYYCMGCTKEMQAVKFKHPQHQSYFRHHVKDIDKSKVECVYSSKEYREKLAFNYFLRTKTIKVPSLYKYPPKGVEGNPILLEESKTIIAHRVDKEVTFCEDENGKIHSGRNIKVDERFLWIRPDAVFYDKNDKPILFLEFVVTHKPDIDKLNKLQRIGIDTVQIIVPKLSEVELEISISQVSKVKWTYNEIESNTQYIPITSGNSEGIPSIDEEQRKLFVEAFTCRATQVGNLIRKINKCMESQSYRGTEQLFEQEIQRIENASAGERARLEEIQSSIESEIHSELGNIREEFDNRKKRFQIHKEDVESRYFKRRGEIREEQKHSDREVKFKYGVGKTEDDLRREFGKTEKHVRAGYDFEESTLERDEEETRKEIDSIVEFEGGIEDLRNDIAERIRTRNTKGNDELSRRIKATIGAWEYIGDYEEKRRLYERYNSYKEMVRSGTWKKW